MTEFDTGADERWVGHVRSLSVLDRALYVLFAHHVDAERHDRDHRRYCGTDMRMSFDLYLARAYGLAWTTGLFVAFPTALVVLAIPDPTVDAVLDVLRAALPLFRHVPIPVVPRFPVVGAFAFAVAVAIRRVVLVVAGQHLSWLATARRENIGRTLPGAVRYLHVLSSGSDGPRGMFRRVAETDAYGETAIAFRSVLNTTSLAGNVNEGLWRVTRDAPPEGMLAPFLLKFREHAGQGSDALRNCLRMESRMFGHRQDRARGRAEGFPELLAELLIVLLVLPSLLVIVLAVISVIAPGLSVPVATPLGQMTTRGVVVYSNTAFIVGVGLGVSVLIAGLRPPDQPVEYDRPTGALHVLDSALSNPASAAAVFVFSGLIVAGVAAFVGAGAVGIALTGYVAYAAPTGLVGVRRARLDDVKDHELKDFVHVISGHVNLGRPFGEAVERVGRDVDLGSLDADVADLALNLRFTAPSSGTNMNLRTAALARFVDCVGTPMTEQAIGLVVGALDGGSDTGTVFDTLRTEIGRLYHEKRTLRSGLLVHVAVGWTTAFLVVEITVVVNVHVFNGFAQFSTLSTGRSFAINADAVDLERDRYQMYIVTQVTMLVSGWFAGTASRGRYKALLHSAAPVVACYLVYVEVDLI